MSNYWLASLGYQKVNYLSHHGILGQKWGVRRYQNPDGTLTDAGKKRYAKDIEKAEEKRRKNARNNLRNFRGISRNAYDLKLDIFNKELSKTKEYKDYAAAQEALDQAETDAYTKKRYASQKEYDRLVENTGKKFNAYQTKIDQTYKKHEKEILSARLKDLNLPDTETYREFYKQYHKAQVSKLGYNPESYLSLFID